MTNYCQVCFCELTQDESMKGRICDSCLGIKYLDTTEELPQDLIDAIKESEE
jgi:hypothetical protein